jgi:predicted N-acetyltransferase YhbS
MTRFVSALDAAGVKHAADVWHPLWGDGLDQASHRARILSQIERSEGRMQVAALQDDDGIACCLKRYRIALRTPAGVVDAVGIGAVATPHARRGQGHASALVRAVMAASAQRGARLALLYSDIATAFYERLGFTTLSHVTWSCRTAALPTASVATPANDDDLDALSAARNASFGDEWLHLQRNASSWRYWAWRNGCDPPRRLADGGYVVVRSSDDQVLWVDEAVGSPETLWPCLRRLAEQSGATRVAGWLRPEQAGGPFVARARARCIPMLAPLDPGLGDVTHWRTHFSSLDHF